MIEKKVLPNGLKILYKKTNTESVALVITVKAGCIYEPDNIMGVSHFLEHMLFNGTKSRTQIEIARAIEDLGGEFNASTDTDTTIYYIKILKKYFDIALEILSDIILNSIFPQEIFDREKGIILDEINMIYDNPRHYQLILFQDALFENHPAKKRISGTKETVTNLTRKQLFNFYKKFYVPNNMIVSVAGDIEDVFLKIENKFKTENKQELILPEIPTQENRRKSIIEKREISQSYIMIGYVIPPRNNPDSFVFDIIRSVLGRSQSGWIFDEVRSKRGLAYEASVFINFSANYGVICVYINGHKKHFEEIKDIIFKQFKRLEDLDEQELESAKNYLEGEFLLENEHTVDLAEEIAFWELCNDANDFETYIDKIRRVSLEEVKATAKRFLNNNYSESIIEQESN